MRITNMRINFNIIKVISGLLILVFLVNLIESAIELDMWMLVAGLGMFLYGMFLLEEAIRDLSGRSFKLVIRRSTKNKNLAISSGTFVTAILQSSSAVSLMVLAFVGAGIMAMNSAIGVIMGANIGTTMTAWIVATLGFKIKISSFALPMMGIGGIGAIFFSDNEKLYHSSKLLIGFGLLFLGLDYMKTSVEDFANNFDISTVPVYGLWLYLLVGIALTALMQSSSATVAIILTALNSNIINFDVSAAMVIGANVGTTVTILLGAIGGSHAKKRVAYSHVVFNVTTGLVAFILLPILTMVVLFIFDVKTNGIMALALFHTIFNILGVAIFYPFVEKLAAFLEKYFPDQNHVLSVHLEDASIEIFDTALDAFTNEIHHLLDEVSLYHMRMLNIDESKFFAEKLPFEKHLAKPLNNEDLYNNVKLLSTDIFTYYTRLLALNLSKKKVRKINQLGYATRSLTSAAKNFKGIIRPLEDFRNSGNSYVNKKYDQFAQRLSDFYTSLQNIAETKKEKHRYDLILKEFVNLNEADKSFIIKTTKAVVKEKVTDMKIADLLQVNRLFTHSCRLQLHSLKDLVLTEKKIGDLKMVIDAQQFIDDHKKDFGRDAGLGAYGM